MNALCTMLDGFFRYYNCNNELKVLWKKRELKKIGEDSTKVQSVQF